MELDANTSVLIGGVIVGIVGLIAWLLNRPGTPAPGLDQPPPGEPTAPAHCPSCKSEVDAHADTCEECGALFEPGLFDCPRCHSEIAYGAPRCNSCGERFLWGDTYLCPSCRVRIHKEDRKCDACSATFWSPVRLPTSGPSEQAKDS